MLLDLNSLEEDAVLRSDVAIIGGGAAGIGIALELMGSGLDVLLVESGGVEYDSETQALYDGDVTGLIYFPLDGARLRFLGGTTNHWHGQSMPLEPVDFDRRDWVPDSGWPIGYDEFRRYLPRAEMLCKLTIAEAGPDVWDLGPGMPAFPLADGGFGPVVIRYPQGDFSFGVVYRRALARAERLRCVLNANAVGFETEGDGQRLSRVRLRSLSGKAATLEADRFVLAAGGIENVRLLLHGATENGATRPMGAAPDLIGRYFMEHPNYDTGSVEIVPDPYLSSPFRQAGSQRLRLDLRLDPGLQAEYGILNHSVFLLLERAPQPGRIGRLWNRLSERATGPAARTGRLRVRLEHAPYADSRITLTDETDPLGMRRVALDMRIGELETRTIERVCEEFARALGIADLGRMQINFDPSDPAWVDDLGWQYHHCGGTRMSDSSSTGVVDRNCRMHGMDNLYVAGGGVFPTCGHANPTMNLLALSIRLADHLQETA